MPIALRTWIEYAVLAGFIYIFLGGSQWRDLLKTSSPDHEDLQSHVSQDQALFLVHPSPDLKCPDHRLDVHLFSRSPLVIYISNFVSKDEARHLLELSEGNWRTSTTFDAGHEVADETVRKSEKAQIDRDQTVQCIEARALSLQGWPEHTFIERLWTQRYRATGHYTYHYDWATADPRSRRASSFMVYLHANCTGGGTHFPLLEKPGDPRWCEFVQCTNASVALDGGEVRGAGATLQPRSEYDDAASKGVTFLPRSGAAVFWENFDSDGRGWKEGLHAGLPVTSGVKIGLNIWSRYRKGLTPDGLAQRGEHDGSDASAS